MKKQLGTIGIVISLSSCIQLDVFDQIWVTSPLFEVKQMIIDCEYENAIDIAQRLTVVGDTSEKKQAYRLLAVIFLEKKEMRAYEHTLDRFMFSVRDKKYVKENLIEQTYSDEREIVALRVAQQGFSICLNEK